MSANDLLINIPLTGGQNEESDDRTQSPGEFGDLLNYGFDKTGTLTKRLGIQPQTRTTYLTGNSAATSAKGMFLSQTREGVVVGADDGLWKLSTNASLIEGPTYSKLADCSVTMTDAVTEASVNALVGGTLNGVSYFLGTNYAAAVTTSVVGGGKIIKIFDWRTGAFITSFVAATTLQCVWQGDVLFYIDSGAQAVKCTAIDYTNPSSPTTLFSATTVVTHSAGYTNSSAALAIMEGTSNEIIVASHATNGANPNELKVGRINTSGTVVAGAAQTYPVGASVLTSVCGYTAQNIFLTTSSNGGFVFSATSCNSTGTFAAALGTIVQNRGTTTAWMVSGVKLSWTTAAGAVTVIQSNGMGTIHGKPALIPGTTYDYILLTHLPLTGTPGGSVVTGSAYTTAIYRISSNNPTTPQLVGRVPLTQYANGNLSGGAFSNSSTSVVSGNQIYYPIVTSSSVLGNSITLTTGVNLQVLNFDFTAQCPSGPLTHARTLTKSRFIENSLGYSARQPSVAAAAGGSLAAGLYGVLVVNRFVADNGDEYQSAPSAIATVSAVLNNKITATVENYFNTELTGVTNNAYGQVYIDVYATEANGTVYYYQGSVVSDPLNAAATQNFVFISILTNTRSVYTSGGTLQNDPPPSFISTTYAQQRLFGVDITQRRVWWTCEKVDQEQYKWSYGFNAPFAGDLLTGIGTLDDKVVCFTKSGIYVLEGTFGDRDGTNLSVRFTLVAANYGCIEPRSIVSTRFGLFFQSAKGIYLLDRSLTVQDVGRNVMDTILANPIITSAAVSAPGDEVRFNCKPTKSSTTGVTLCFHFMRKRWTVYQYLDSYTSTSSAGFNGMCQFDGSIYMLGQSGGLFKESSTSYLDNTSFVQGQIVTTWITPAYLGVLAQTAAPLTGIQRIKRFCLNYRRQSAANLTIEAQYDYDETSWATLATFTDAVLTAAPLLDEVEVHIPRQKCAAIRFRITCSDPGVALGSGRGLDIVGLGLRVGLKQGLGGKLLPDAKKD